MTTKPLTRLTKERRTQYEAMLETINELIDNTPITGGITSNFDAVLRNVEKETLKRRFKFQRLYWHANKELAELQHQHATRIIDEIIIAENEDDYKWSYNEHHPVSGFKIDVLRNQILYLMSETQNFNELVNHYTAAEYTTWLIRTRIGTRILKVGELINELSKLNPIFAGHLNSLYQHNNLIGYWTEPLKYDIGRPNNE